MTTPFLRRRTIRWTVVGMMALLIGLSLTSRASANQPAQETEKYCLSCHGNSELEMTLPSGETLPLYISQDVIRASVHSPLGIECEACHTDITTYPHPPLEYKNKRELSRVYYQSCEKCHSANYQKSLDSVHARAAEAGNLEAPVCTDCHGAHDVHDPDQPRSRISETCSRCHAQIVETYKQSVHGQALLADNPDVPVCTDCHGVHNIQDPRTAQFRVDSPELCAGCHANSELMDKYGLSADVYDIYKHSWHGVDISIYKARWPTIRHDSAVCTDCHGVHDIRMTDDPQSSGNPTNLLSTCQKCHPSAGPNWTDAWTGHNRISLERTPILYYVNAFYTFLTPFVLWACIIYVVLQIVHAVVDRVRKEQPDMTTKQKNAKIIREKFYPRFGVGARWEHLILILSCLVLLLTGLPQKYPALIISRALLSTPEQVSMIRQIHHIAAIVLTLEVVYHLGLAILLMTHRKLPGDLLPTWQDVRDVGQMLQYLLFLRKDKPKFGKYNFEQKVTYWLLFFGMGIMVISGFIIRFPVEVTKILPGGVIPAAKMAHSAEAIVTFIFILVWHVYHVHVERLNLSMFTGRLSENEMKTYHTKEYERLTGSKTEAGEKSDAA